MFARTLVQWLFNPGEPAGGGFPPPGYAPAPAPAPAGAPPIQQAVMPFATAPPPPPAAPQVPPAAVAPAPPAPPPPAVVPVPAEELTRLYSLQAQLQRIESERQAESERLRAETLQAEAKRGAVDESFTKFRQESEAKFQALERQYLDSETRRAVQAALAPSLPKMRPEVVEMVTELVAKGITAVRGADGRILIHDPVTGRPADAVIAERLASAPFQVFFLPSTPGGAPGAFAGAAAVPTPPPGGPAGVPQTLGERIAAQYAAHQQNAQRNPAAPRGLSGR